MHYVISGVFPWKVRLVKSAKKTNKNLRKHAEKICEIDNNNNDTTVLLAVAVWLAGCWATTTADCTAVARSTLYTTTTRTSKQLQ